MRHFAPATCAVGGKDDESDVAVGHPFVNSRVMRYMAQRPATPGLCDRPDARAEGMSPPARSPEIGVEAGMPAETVAATIMVGGRVHDIIAAPDGELIYVAES